ncbi:ATP-binding protein [Sphingomonas spermidinifaciens]|uniref:ATP-binding protein n=1 Tax=Sphingomonas spermidinifaciens TaxID=1141889 RepID=A0A2A4B3V9_9SPHN|nr:ATP-binding protein [Sphingomonas spermidinifaciens]
MYAELSALDAGQRQWLFDSLKDREVDIIDEAWEAWAHDGQLAPPGDWAIWLIRAGRGFGKTRAGAEWVSAVARANPECRIALVGGSIDEVRRVMVEGPSGLLAVAHAGERAGMKFTGSVLRFANRAEAYVYSAGAPERLRGPEHHFAWADELGKWRARAGAAAWDNLRLGLRLGERPRLLVTTTPRPTVLMRRVMALPGLVQTLGRTRDNPHLPASFVGAMVADYGGTRLGRQELDGEMVEDVAGALWTRGLIEGCRVRAAPELVRVVVGVDPPAGTEGDACGIVAVGLGGDARGYVLEDASVVGASPEGWARAVVACVGRHGAERVVAEVNQGGAMVASVLRAVEASLPVRGVHATRGKAARAEPVAALYEQGRVAHVGAFPALEDELCGLVAGGRYEGPGRSPDRADACVWALSELMLGRRGGVGVRGV